MKIIGVENMSPQQLQSNLQMGGKFVLYEYCISILILTFKRPSDIYFIKPGEDAIGKGLIFSLISLLFGWWGIPWGPIYTIGSFITNFRGGKDVTADVLAALSQPEAPER